MSDPELENEAVRLREWRREDAPVLAAVCGEPAVCTFTSVPWTYGRAAAEAWIERQWRKRKEGGTLALAIEDRGGRGAVAGAGEDVRDGEGTRASEDARGGTDDGQAGGDRNAGLPVGNVNLTRLGDGGEEGSLGYWLVPDARGRGLASAAARLLCDWGFAELGLARIEFEIRPDNVASQRLAERLGASRRGLHRESRAAEGRRWDTVVYSLEPPATGAVGASL